MIIRIKDVNLKITKNKNNRFWNPIGQLWNTSQIEIEGEWYSCGLKFIKLNKKHIIQFYNPMKVDVKTKLIKKIICEGTYKEIETSFFKYNLIQYLINRHVLNSISYKIRRFIHNKQITFLIFSLALIPSITFYLINIKYDNLFIHLIAENVWVQTLIFFLTISSFINIFHPFTIRKEIDEKDIKEITKEILEEEKNNEEIRRNATF